MYDDILFPTDGSDGAAVALEHALDLAELSGATVHVLYVADTDRDSITVLGGQVVDALEEEGERVVRETLDTAGDRVDVVGEVVQGEPHATIQEYAEGHDVDLVVMATHGRQGLDRYLLGSVTERVVRTSPVPVLTVRMDEE
ncbi:universal stress protein [Halomarina ordinaria]|uniref:Universal stress protein n=1 Tax=Halomarina ordinaria TaxID=3033939 RepID=A0ABD5U7Y0_9EURY|nr:universal stress protein [Halomarina sp. PSRA2]